MKYFLIFVMPVNAVELKPSIHSFGTNLVSFSYLKLIIQLEHVLSREGKGCIIQEHKDKIIQFPFEVSLYKGFPINAVIFPRRHSVVRGDGRPERVDV